MIEKINLDLAMIYDRSLTTWDYHYQILKGDIENYITTTEDKLKRRNLQIADLKNRVDGLEEDLYNLEQMFKKEIEEMNKQHGY